MLNTSAACPSETLAQILTEAVDQVSRDFQLELVVYKQECFGMGG